MNRSQLEHIVRACGAITRDNEFVVVGSQSILGKHADAPEQLLRSMELDVFPKNQMEDSLLIDGAIGEGSLFHQTFGYYAHGVGAETAVLPEGWQQRLISVSNANTQGAIGWCLDPRDLAVSKLAAGRPNDYEFVNALFAHSLVTHNEVTALLEKTPLTLEQRGSIVAFLEAVRTGGGCLP